MNYFIRQYWKIIVGLVAIFIGGLGFGAVLESLRHRSDPPPPIGSQPDKDWIASTLASLDGSLDLTEEQQSEILPQIEAAAREIQLTRQSALLKFEITLLDLHRSIAPKLEDDQKETLLKSQRALEQRIKQRSEGVLGAFPSEAEE